MRQFPVSSILLALGIFVLSACSEIAVLPQSEGLWIFDAHSHTVAGWNLEEVISWMDSSGVRKIVLFARRQGTDEEILRLHTRYPERVIPTIGFQNPGWLTQKPSFLDEVEAKLKSGRFRWMGELLLRHYGVPELGAPDFDISPDTSLFRRVLDLSARYQVPLTIHHEAEEGNIDVFRRALSHNQKAIVIWAHWCGRSTPEIARSFLSEFPNLYCDLGASYPGVRYGQEKNPLIGSNGTLLPQWKALIEEFPDRFLAAIDAVEPVHYKKFYGAAVNELRKTLSQVRSQAARRVAFENAERLLTFSQRASPTHASEAVAPKPTREPSIVSKTTMIPIINAHEHIMPGLSPEKMLSILDELGVSKVILMGALGGQKDYIEKGFIFKQINQLALNAHEKYPDRVIPFLSLNQAKQITPQLLKYLDSELVTGKFFGMGELKSLHQGMIAKKEGVTPEGREVRIPLDSPGALDIFCLAATYNVVLNIHMTFPPIKVSASERAELISEMERALQRNLHTKVMWAHQHHPYNDPDQVAALMDKYPNFYADISPAIPRPAPVNEPIPEKWKRVYEKYNDRFAVGFDSPFLHWWTEKPERVRERAKLVRTWLSQLSPETQRKFAYENIERILAAKPASIRTCSFMTK